jgi:hypothetical protein
MDQLKACTAQVEGDEMYSDGVKTYVISKAKMARMGSEKPSSEEDRLKFFKVHADTVIETQKNVPVVKVDRARTTEQK